VNNTNANSYLNGNLAFSTSVADTMLSLTAQTLLTNNAGSLTNLNASRLDLGTVPRLRQETALQNFLNAYFLAAGGTITGAGPLILTNGIVQATGFTATGNGSISQDTVTLSTSAEIFRLTDSSSGKDMLWFSIDAPDSGQNATMLESHKPLRSQLLAHR
jgi:hypothetical protein